MTQKAIKKTAAAQPAVSAVAKLPQLHKTTKTLMLVNAVIAFLAVLMPFVPLATKVNEHSDVIWYNMIGIINQDIGTNETRGPAVALMLFFAVGVILLAAGLVNTTFGMKSSAVFLLLGGTSLAAFSVAWTNIMFGFEKEPNPAVPNGAVSYTQIDAAKVWFEHSPFPILMIILSFALIGVSLAVLCVYKEKTNRKTALGRR